MRCFIAVELPGNIRGKIFHKFEILQRKNLFKGKITEKENLHLTLKFLGEISEEKIKKVQEKLSGIKFEKFSCNIGNPGVFKNEKFIKIIFVELISENNKLEKLQKKISEKLPEFYEKRKFSSHVTTARVKFVDRSLKEKLVQEIEKINFKDLNFEADEFVLMKSELFPQGPRYKILEKFKLEWNYNKHD